MAPVNVERILLYAWQDRVEDLKAEILEGGVLKEEVKLQKDDIGGPFLALLLKSACFHNATSVVKFLASTVDKHMLNHHGHYRIPHSIRKYHGSALHAAVDRRSAKCLQYLLDAGADPNVTDEYGKTPLHYASELGHIDCMRHLLDSKANPNQPDKDKRTPLHYATIENKADCVLHLLQAGANPDQGDKAGYGTAISIYSANAFP
ncbi:ankyrin repeat domain-containing protein 23-like [Sycon ciliatum]|uniref:ankyrin repeat domain-containing protein 23-like n=1 Tax=Sycon ciliatum TaxID=27933 RepID=UPI0031F6CCE0